MALTLQSGSRPGTAANHTAGAPAAPVPRAAAVLVALVAAGVAVVAPPAIAIGAFAAVALVAVGLRNPVPVAHLAVLCLAISPQFALSELAPPASLLSAQKAFVLLCLAPAVIRYGLRVRFLWPVAAQVLVAAAVFALPGSFTSTGGDAAAAAAGAAVAWLALAVRWPAGAARRMLVTVAALPLISVLLGIALDLGGVSALFRPEPSGIMRLQGASIPAHLAAMCLVGAFASVLLLRLGERRLALRGGATALIVVCLSLTRTDIAASAVILLPLVVAWIRYSASVTVLGFKVWLTAIAAAIAIAAVAPLLLARSGAETSDSQFGIDDSGRSAAWALFYADFEDKPVLGHGPGSLEALAWENGKARGNVFRAPHNEYLRLLVEGGVVFGAMLAVVIARALWLARSSVPPAMRGPVSAMLFVVALACIVENTFVTPQFMVPFTFALGAAVSLGLERRHAQPEAAASVGAAA